MFVVWVVLPFWFSLLFVFGLFLLAVVVGLRDNNAIVVLVVLVVFVVVVAFLVSFLLPLL